MVDSEDVGMLEDLVAGAIKDAMTKAEDASESAMKGVTGGLGMPGMM